MEQRNTSLVARIKSLLICGVLPLAASVGAGALTAIAREVEALARAGQSVAPENHPARLRSAFEDFCALPAMAALLAPQFPERDAA